MTTNTEHLIAACAKLIACGPNRERMDDVEAALALVRLEMRQDCKHANTSLLYAEPRSLEPEVDASGEPVWFCLDCLTASDDPARSQPKEQQP